MEDKKLSLPREWNTYYVWLFVPNPAYEPGSKAQESALSAAHIQYQLRLQQGEQALAAGGFGAGTGDSFAGMTLLRAESLEAALALAHADPVVQAGRLIAWVREWWVPAGRLPSPR